MKQNRMKKKIFIHQKNTRTEDNLQTILELNKHYYINKDPKTNSNNQGQ